MSLLQLVTIYVMRNMRRRLGIEFAVVPQGAATDHRESYFTDSLDDAIETARAMSVGLQSIQ